MPKKNITPSGEKSLPVRREEYHPLSLLREEMNTLFDNFFRGFELEPFRSHFEAFSPNINVKESEKDISVTAELPGMDDKDIDISLTRESLTIKGEKKEDREEKGKNYYRMERSFGSFSRSIPLPAEIDVDKVKAEFKKGVLTVRLPKTPKAIKETKKISVKAE